MSDYRQAQEQQEHQEWLIALEAALRSDDKQAMDEMAAKLKGYIDERLHETV